MKNRFNVLSLVLALTSLVNGVFALPNTNNQSENNRALSVNSRFNSVLPESVGSFPTFAKLKSFYLGSAYQAEDVYRRIGGRVFANHSADPAAYSNSCALRMSYALNNAGAKIPYISGQTGSGADGNWYFYRVSDLKNYLLRTYGQPDVTIAADDPNFDRKVAARQGIIIFDVSGWNDATGHVTLWDGRQCGDHCYFAQDLAESSGSRAKLRSVSIWVIN